MIALVLLGLAGATPDYSYALGPDGIVITAPEGETTTVPVPCAATALEVDQSKLFLACGAAGVATLNLADPLAPTHVGTQSMDGVVVGFMRDGGVLWVMVRALQARPLTAHALPPSGPPRPVTAPTVPTTPTPPAASESSENVHAPPPRWESYQPRERVARRPEPRRQPVEEPLDAKLADLFGVVTEVTDEGAVIDIGSDDGLRIGDRIRFTVRESVSVTSGGRTSKQVRAVSVGEVIVLGPNEALVSLGMNERVPEMATAQTTNGPTTKKLISHPRLGGIMWATGTLRPFVGISRLALGTVSDLAVGYRFEMPIHLQLQLEPLGLAWRDPGGILASAGNVIVSYDTTYFELGLGGGWSTAQLAPTPGFGVALAQLVRLGSIDGLHFLFRNQFVLYNNQFNYGGAVAQLRIPISHGLWLEARGGGGVAGYFYGEMGMRLLLSGNGDSGSWFIAPSLGGGGLMETGGCQWCGQLTYAGPLASIGLEWRP